MSYVDRPIPNQPVFTWPIHQAAILVRGHTHGKNGHHLSMYAKVISGTQTGVAVPGGVVISKGGAIQIYGFGLPVPWLLGATRYRIPLIVHIWNVMVNGIQLLVTVGELAKSTAVTAAARTETSAIGTVHMQLEHDTNHRIKLWFSTNHTMQSLHKLHTDVKTTVRMFKIQTRGVLVLITGKLKMSVSVLTMVIERAAEMSVAVLTNAFEYASKMSVSALTYIMERASNLSASTLSVEQESTHKLSTSVPIVDHSEVADLSVEILPLDIEQTQKLSVHPIPQEIAHVSSTLKLDVEGQWLEQDIDVKTEAVYIESEKPVTVHTGVQETTSTGHVVFNLLTAFEVLKRISFQLVDHLYAVKGLLVHLYETGGEALLRTNVYESGGEVDIHIPVATPYREQIVYCPFITEGFDGKFIIHIQTETWYDEFHYLEADIIAQIARTKLQFKPMNAPQVQRIQCLMYICNTSVQAYISYYVADEHREIKTMKMTACSVTVRRLLQWYLMGGRISNEGYGNEIIFDLGDVNPIGPIPPSPSLNWGGGYVEDPFIGAGYVPADDSTGYNSPEADRWVKNVAMYWGQASTPFEEP